MDIRFLMEGKLVRIFVANYCVGFLYRLTKTSYLEIDNVGYEIPQVDFRTGRENFRAQLLNSFGREFEHVALRCAER